MILSEGSSPHTRGAPRRRATTATCGRDHPRIRGEHQHKRERTRPIHGINPAYAGSTRWSGMTANGVTGSSPHTRGARCRENSPAACGRDHPRIRGEHAREGQGEGGAEGIIPAYAGSTRPMPLSLYQLRGSSPHTRGAPHATSRGRHSAEDHPRIRGEHSMRHVQRCCRVGIIPAYAGSTMISSQSWVPVPGSSPHTRGARAGMGCSRLATEDHPRIRGEHRVRA